MHMGDFINQQLGKDIKPWDRSSVWYAQWLAIPHAASPFVGVFALPFCADAAMDITIHVAAHPRYALYLDDVLLGRGSEAGDLSLCYYESYQLNLSQGAHELCAIVWNAGDGNQPIQLQTMFLLTPDSKQHNDLLATGFAPWQCSVLPQYEFINFSQQGICAGPRIRYTQPDGSPQWIRPVPLAPGYSGCAYYIPTRNVQLLPATISMVEERLFFRGEWTLTDTPHIIPLDNYYCFYARITIQGKAGDEVQLYTSERRDTVAYGDCFGVTSEAPFVCSTLDWLAGAFVHLSGSQGVRVRLELFETRAALQVQGKLQCDNASLERLFSLAIRSLMMCCHDTFMDCPFWERIMYIGDTRLQGLASYTLQHDAAPIKKAIRLFARSANNPTGLPTCSYPGDGSKIIPSFCLVWVYMLQDLMLWRGERAFVEAHAPLALNMLFSQYRDGMIPVPQGWDYYDSTYDEEDIQDQNGATLLYQLMFALALEQLAKVQRFLGEPDIAQSCLNKSKNALSHAISGYWDEGQGLFADTLSHNRFSQHVQSVALLLDGLDSGKKQRIAVGLVHDKQLKPTNIYFSHYLFDACYHSGMGQQVITELERWDAQRKADAFTLPENWGDTRSECHGWGAHSIYHYYATICGIRPDGAGFERVSIRPALGTLKNVTAHMPHPKGSITMDYQDGVLRIGLPKGVEGTLYLNGQQLSLQENNEISVVF